MSDIEEIQGNVGCQGFTEKEGVDFNDVLSPVVNYKSIRMQLSMVAKLNLELEKMDGKTRSCMGIQIK